MMDPEKPHCIQFVWLNDMKTSKFVAIASFEATDTSPPSLTTLVEAGSTALVLQFAWLFCGKEILFLSNE